MKILIYRDLRLRETNIDFMYIFFFLKLGKGHIANPAFVIPLEFKSVITNNSRFYRAGYYLPNE